MSKAQSYLLVINDDKTAAQEIANSTADDLQAHRTTLIDVVKSLDEYITSQDDKVRAKAISYLTAVLNVLPANYLSRQQIQVLSQFLCDRIEDGGAIDGLSKLQSLDRFTNEMAQTVVRAVFEHFADLQSRPQSGRYRILQLLNELMSVHRKGMRAMGDEWLVGLTDLVSGEKDPRNLMIIFSMLRVIIIEWDITSYTEVLFDSVYAYFPITFRPPPNDPYGITAQDLKDRLRDCLSASKLLAPSVIPNLLDKLDSTSVVVKKDVLHCLLACAQSYDSFTMSQYSVTLWDSLKFEVLTPQEPELAQETCLVLREITVCLSNSTQQSPTASPLAQYLRPVIKECNETLQEPAQRQAKGAGEILKAVSSANALSFVSIIKAVVAPTLTLYQSADSSLKRRALLDVWNLLSEAGLEVWGSWKDHKLAPDDLTENPLLQFKENFLDLYGEAMMSTGAQEASFRISAAKGLLLLSKIRNFFDESEIGLVVRHFNAIILDENTYDHDELRLNAMRGLSEISSFQPRLIMDVSFPAFIARLPENEVDAATSKNYSVVLEGLFEISAEKEVSETLIRRLLNKIDILFRDSSGAIEYTFATLATIHRALARRPDHLNIYYDRIVVGLVRTAAEALKSKVSSPLRHERILDLLGRTANIIILQSTLDKKTEVCKNAYLLYSDLGIDTLTKSHAGDEIQKMLVISTWLLAALPRDLPGLVFDTESVCRVTQKLVNCLLHTKLIPSAEGACLRQVALYVNKHFGKSEFPLVTELMSHFYKSVSTASSTGDSDHSSLINVKLIFILTKALVLRLALNTNQLLSDLTSLLDPQNHPLHVTTMAASSFSMLLSEDEVLSKSNYFEIRLLSTQRVFHTLTPILSSKFKDTSNPIEKENCLTALSGIISTVPSELVMPQIAALLPLLLQSLDLSNQGVKIATLETLAVVLVNNPSTLEESGHVPTLIKRLLLTANTQRGKTDKMDTTNLPRTRELAIRCLRMMPGHITGGGSRSDPLLALKGEVLQKLVKILDDPKRDIRKEAVDARAAWIRGVDDVKEDEEDD